MKSPIYCTIIAFFLVVTGTFAQASIKHSQTFASNSAVKLNIDMHGENIEIKKIKGTRIVVETIIKISSPNTRLLEFIAEGGRYDLEKSFDNATNEMTLTYKKNQDVITIKGEEIKEEISYVIYIPELTEYVHHTAVAANF